MNFADILIWKIIIMLYTLFNLLIINIVNYQATLGFFLYGMLVNKILKPTPIITEYSMITNLIINIIISQIVSLFLSLDTNLSYDKM